ncbi:MAG: acyl-CoA thioesterase [Chloroflexota bacterium]
MEDLRSYAHSIEVQPEDADELGHVNNVVYLRYVEDVARAHADSVGMTLEAVTRLGAVPVVRRHDITYHRAGMVGDRLKVSTVIERGTGVRWLRRNDVRRGSELLAHAVTEWVWLDPKTRRPKRLPSAIENAFGFGDSE